MIRRSKGLSPLVCYQNAQNCYTFMPERGRTETQDGHSVVKFLCIIFRF